jgi:hypothetical protein
VACSGEVSRKPDKPKARKVFEEAVMTMRLLISIFFIYYGIRLLIDHKARAARLSKDYPRGSWSFSRDTTESILWVGGILFLGAGILLDAGALSIRLRYVSEGFVICALLVAAGAWAMGRWQG